MGLLFCKKNQLFPKTKLRYLFIAYSLYSLAAAVEMQSVFPGKDRYFRLPFTNTLTTYTTAFIMCVTKILVETNIPFMSYRDSLTLLVAFLKKKSIHTTYTYVPSLRSMQLILVGTYIGREMTGENSTFFTTALHPSP